MTMILIMTMFLIDKIKLLVCLFELVILVNASNGGTASRICYIVVVISTLMC